MLFNPTFSMVGMIFSALYISLVKVVLAYFECPENPAAGATLAKFKDVVCGSDEHMEALPAMVMGLLLYVVGCYLLFLHAAFIAPKKWADVDFREKWRFMLTRWRPDVWFWGSTMMTRNLLVAFAGVISTEPRVQLLYAVSVVLVAMTSTCVWQPWRTPVLNHYDTTTGAVLCFIGMFGTLFTSLQDEIRLSRRFGLNTVVAGKESLRDDFATVLMVLVGVFVALVVSLCGWCLHMVLTSMTAAGRKRAQEAYEQPIRELVSSLEDRVKDVNFLTNAAALLGSSTAYDRAGLKSFLDKLTADRMTQQGGVTDTIIINEAKRQRDACAADKASPATVSA